MTHTRVLDKSIRVVPGRAQPYERSSDGVGFVSPRANSRLVGATNVFTSIDDLARWDRSFYEPTLGGGRLVAMLRTPGTLDDGRPLDYAMGLVETTQGGVAREDHTGEDLGYVADVVRYPGERLTVAVLCNDEEIDAGELAQRVVAALLPKTRAAASSARPVADDAAVKLPAWPEVAPRDPAGAPRSEPIDVPASALAEYVGRYTSDEILQDKELSVRDGALVLGTYGRTRGTTPLSPVQRDVWSGDGGLPFAVALTFHRDAQKRVIGFTLRGGDMTFELVKRADETPAR